MSKNATVSADGKLTPRDVVTIGLLSLLLMVMLMAMMTAFFLVPVIYPLALAITAIPAGVVMILLLARVPKRGALFLCGFALALMMLATGHHIVVPIVLTAGALVAELIWNATGRGSFAGMRLGYCTLMAGYTVAAFAPFAFLRESAIAETAASGYDVQAITTALNLVRPSTLGFIAAITFGGAWLGAAFGRRLLRKHFERAGRV